MMNFRLNLLMIKKKIPLLKLKNNSMYYVILIIKNNRILKGKFVKQIYQTKMLLQETKHKMMELLPRRNKYQNVKLSFKQYLKIEHYLVN